MKVVAVNGSPRKKGNTQAIIDVAAEELRAAGIEVELIKEIPSTNLASYESLLAGFQDGYNKIMIEFNIPGRDPLQLQHLVCDVNGTLAVYGRLLDGLARSLASLRDRLQVHLLTADTHGKRMSSTCSLISRRSASRQGMKPFKRQNTCVVWDLPRLPRSARGQTMRRC